MKELYTTAGIFVVLILLGVWMVQNNRNEQEKKLVQLRKKWGKKQEKRTAREKKEKLEACLRRKAGENFYVDAITWNDLDLDSMYMMVNQTISSPGEDVLYSMMRLPGFSKEEADKVVKNMQENNYARFSLAGVVVIDADWLGKKICGVPVVANAEELPMYVCQEWIDEVLIVVSEVLPYPSELIEQLSETGVTIHLNLAKITSVPGKKQFVEKVGNYTVLTTSINYASTRQLMLKRLMDIAGGLVGCIFTGIICIFVGPAIYIASPGPIFFAQERVGKNGKKFKMYKFRSMYMDAEERKAELMKDNKLGDGKMFKLDFDPRVIGNKILPDGTHKTGIGDFIRRTSLDEFPQFFNVLRGDMSIIGTRPPLISETNLYELHHRARLAIKPGITGMWQVSGRSDITDFEEVVRLDKEYITNWNIGLDIKILLKTILVVFRKDGSM